MELDAILNANDYSEANLIPILLAAQELSEENYISECKCQWQNGSSSQTVIML